ncbi:BTAD domain-containing putative transcriptional regulator [Sciscionella sediminilitoris]|uniref:BTAD domain-containing putative transcriptional regulator n=1 Tax=Sciscionella sediminilitoris TaxID=1445613 RepID=UPI0005647311|nr:BTAD domain-containing putative transcriptional regulator [Sciscionella sp. SE31]
MRFELLGPFDIVHNGRPVVLRGSTQRAVLAYLLLHHNEVVATSSLLSALWPEQIPATARKMVQNAVSGLRSTLAAGTNPGEQEPMLLTHAPGYLLRIDDEQLDLARFRRLSAAGRGARDNGDTEGAVSAMTEALALWRGRMLADLAEAGVNWPELGTLEDERLALHEDLFALELDRGRHREVLSALQEQATANPNRERLNAQLMTALYRCGRAVDALEVFRATRASLTDELGLEPGRELRELERAILQHDEAVLDRTPPAEADPQPMAAVVPASPMVPVPAPELAEEPGDTGEERPDFWLPRETEAERKPVVAVGIAAATSDDPEEAGEVLARLWAVVEEEAATEDARLPGMHGPVLLAVYGLPRTREDDAVRAVRTALRIRDRLTESGIAVQVSVETGDVLTTPSAIGEESVTGPVLDRCVRSTLSAPEGRVRVVEAVREASEPEVGYTATEQDGRWEACLLRPRPAPEPPDTLTFAGREHELELLHQFLGFVERGGHPHRVTLRGEPGIGKTRLLIEFRQLLEEYPRIRVLDVAGDLLAAFASAPGLLPATMAGLRGGDGGPALRAAATELTANGPLVVLADDVQDAELRTRLSWLGEACAGLPVLILTAERPDPLDVPPQTVTGQTTIVLAPLADKAVAKLLDVLLPNTNRLARTRHELITRIGGNPRFAQVYARAVHDRTTLSPALGHTAPPTPAAIRRTLAALLDSLAPAEKSVLKAATLTGEFFDADEVTEVCGRDRAEVAMALGSLAAQGLLEHAGHGFAFRWAPLRELAYQRIPRSASTELVRRFSGGRTARTEIPA